MRVYFDVGYDSFGISRAALNMAKYMPSELQITTDPDSADLVVIHINGRHDHNTLYSRRVLAKNHKYVVAQYVLESSRNPDPKDWSELWNNAKFVWSYYDLSKYVENFYHTPLAADPDKFYRVNVDKKYLIGTNGNAYKDECLGEVRLAAYQTEGNVIHVGPKFGEDPITTSVQNISDDELRTIYNQCWHFSALRRKDGFEMVALEALLCGVRPVMFDTPNYRQWFNDFAVFVPEVEPELLVKHLNKILKQEIKVVGNGEIEEVKNRFNWETIMKGFWERCMN